ncbi:MAG: MBL fold metallo-hydrolase, partial [Myxococcota bacterium]
TSKPAARKWLRLALRLVAMLAASFAVFAAWALSVAWVPMGKAPEGERLARMEASPNSKDGVFVNKQNMYNDVWGALTSASSMSEYAEATGPLPVYPDTAKELATPPNGTRITWLGHSTVLMELAGKRVLSDPIFGPSPSPIEAFGPARWYAPPLALHELRDVDIVLISHDHYDHLDYPTIAAMRDWEVKFVTPLGIGAHLEYWGVAPERIVELDWWEEYELGDLRIAATPARHASGRQAFDQMRTQWAGYALIGPKHRIMFSGDTGLFDDMANIGERYGPFDLVMIEVGAYHETWPDWHIGPEQAMVAHEMMRGKLFMPIHIGLFNLALHGWTEPMERLWVAATKRGVDFTVPRPGQPFLIGDAPKPERWWPDLPWETAAQHPIVSTRNGDPNERYPVP